MKEIPMERKVFAIYNTTNYDFNVTSLSWGPTEIGNSLY